MNNNIQRQPSVAQPQAVHPVDQAVGQAVGQPVLAQPVLAQPAFPPPGAQGQPQVPAPVEHPLHRQAVAPAAVPRLPAASLDDHRAHPRIEQRWFRAIALIGAAVIGALAGGPVGAAVAVGIAALVLDRLDKQAVAPQPALPPGWAPALPPAPPYALPHQAVPHQALPQPHQPQPLPQQPLPLPHQPPPVAHQPDPVADAQRVNFPAPEIPQDLPADAPPMN